MPAAGAAEGDRGNNRSSGPGTDRSEVYRRRGRIRRRQRSLLPAGGLEGDRESAGDRGRARAGRPGLRRAAGRAVAYELRRPREPRTAGRAGGCGSSRAPPKQVFGGAGAAGGPRPGRCRSACHRSWSVERGVAGVCRCRPWWEGEINVDLFESVLGGSAARGPARLLLATMAAVADAGGAVRDLSTEQLCAAAGVADRTYRRARISLLESGELVLVSGAGGRGNTNVRTVPDPRSAEGAEMRRPPRRVAPPAGARPLVAFAKRSDAGTLAVASVPTAPVKDGHDRTLAREDRPLPTGFPSKGRSGSDAFRAGICRNPGSVSRFSIKGR